MDEDDGRGDEELSSFKRAINRRSAKIRPPAAPFNMDKMHELGIDVSTDGDFYVCGGNRYARGLLYKLFPLSSITDENIQPTFEELKHFQERPTTDPEFFKERKSSIAQIFSSTQRIFSCGNKVERLAERFCCWRRCSSR